YAELTAVKRPQTPQPPFAYEAIDVVVDHRAASLQLAGTLTVPPGDGPHPVVLLVTGSGAQDRDETIFGHKPFLVLADHLAKHGIAALRLDDRGVGGSGGDPKTSTTADFVGDALAAVAFLRTRPRLDPARIGIIGHSEGAIVAPAAAAADGHIAFVVMLAGSGVPGSEILLDQSETFARAAGKSDAEVAQMLDLQRKLFAAVRSTSDDAQLRATLRPLLAEQPGVDAKAVDAELEVLLSPWYRHFVAYDPGTALRKLETPVLVLNGELDRQVDAELNVPAIVKALKKAGNRRVTVHRLPGINHLFQRAKTGMVDEYGTIEETIAPEVLALVSDWILATAKPLKGRSRPRS
ncbi:MAG TPA: alpha/beta fold hydrolase, partial [Nannocystaceae bacterium]|nr:alpha/beta fold hydrolase [Nannocystaceae bacterium]